MSDQHGSDPLPELTPEQDATVRRLLAEARRDEPLPPEVGDRLDRVLADLSSSSPERSGPVVDLAARRRRRNAGGLLVAAAAVIVGGFAVGQVVGGESSDNDSAGGSADSSLARESPGKAAGSDVAPAAPQAAAGGPLRLTSDNLEQDVEHQLRKRSASPEAGLDSLAEEPGFGCTPAALPAYGLGELFAALYDGAPAVLALRPPEGDTQEAQVLDCDTGTPLRSVTVPVP
jgi:hypothetical protein